MIEASGFWSTGWRNFTFRTSRLASLMETLFHLTSELKVREFLVLMHYGLHMDVGMSKLCLQLVKFHAQYLISL